MEPLTRLVVQESLTEDEVDSCRGVLLSLLGMESRHEFPAAQLPSNLRLVNRWNILFYGFDFYLFNDSLSDQTTQM